MTVSWCAPSPLAVSGGSGSVRATPRPIFRHVPNLISSWGATLTAYGLGGCAQVAWHAIDVQLERFATQPAQAAVKALSDLPPNWDHLGSAAPNPVAIANAMAILPELYLAVTGQEWQNPHVSASDVGDVIFEWWSQGKKLTLYIGPAKVEFLQIWGPDIHDEMASGELDTQMFADLWAWLFPI